MRIRHSWSFMLRATFLVLSLLVAAAGPAFSYLYQQDVSTDCSVTMLRCSDIGLPKFVKLEWVYPGLNPAVAPTFEIKRNTTVLGTTTNNYWVDTTLDWAWSTNYSYSVRVKTDAEASMGLPAPPMGANPADIFMRKVASGNPWVTITVRPEYVLATANQTVDSRLDLRYATNVHKDFLFGSRVYRGGLFCGFANDPSRVARSLIGFTLPDPPDNVSYWTGSLNCYHTRNAATSTATVGVHEVSDAWTESGTAWTNAPSMTPGSPLNSQSVAWDSAAPVSSWKHFPLREPFGLAFFGDGVVSFGLAATNEAANAFAYFAKTQWDANYGPRVVYAMGAPSAPLELTVSPSSVTGGTSSTGTVYLNCFRTASTTINLSSSNTAAATVTSNISIPAGDTSKTFPITTYAVGASTPVTITATRNGYSETTTLTVNP